MAVEHSRRDFLKSGGILLAGAAIPSLAAASNAEARPQRQLRLRVGLFHDPAFPTVDCAATDTAALRTALRSCDIIELSTPERVRALVPSDIDVLLTMHGSAFPEEYGALLLGYLQAGGCWVNIGGTPLAVPARWNGGGWTLTPRRTAWHRHLRITQSMELPCDEVAEWTGNPGFEGMDDIAASISPRVARGMALRLSNSKHIANEDGSSGPRDARVTALVHGRHEDGTVLVAPVVMLDWLLGDYAGARWIWYTGDTAPGSDAVARLVEIAASGAVELRASSAFATLAEGDIPEATIRIDRPRREGDAEVLVELLHDGTLIEAQRQRAQWSAALGGSAVGVRFGTRLTIPGLYELRVGCTLRDGAGSVALTSHGGFVVRDEALLRSAPPLRVRDEMLWRGDTPFVVAGTSYMAGDVQRSFLFDPNPWQWDSDFAAMRASGVNLVRTGIWTGWRRIMFDSGAVDEGVLRAFEAFVHVAARHGIVVIFSFFAFLPESWGGANPYLDPRAVAAQSAFIAAFVRRMRNVQWLIWDLINEPSFCSPARLWQCRPNYDAWEEQAWRAWLTARHGNGNPEQLQRVLGDLWRSDTGEYGALPRLDEFEDANVFSDRRPLKAMEYRLFAQQAFTDWALALRAVIAETGGGAQLVMVGQDEGGTMDRPSPMFFAPAVDIGSIHNWWFNDDILWDSIVTRAPGKAHLVQESGVMMYERADGLPWRSEEEVARLLERKLAVSLGAGSIGYVHWLWNSNPWMPSDNEAAIGALRADGSAKPEYDVLRRLNAFIGKHHAHFRGRRNEHTVLILPHANQFSVRGTAVRASKAALRALAYGCRLPVRAMSEQRLHASITDARLLLLPHPSSFSEEAWSRLLEAVRSGATMLVTGVIDRDEHWRELSRSTRLRAGMRIRPVSPYETIRIDDEVYVCGYRGEDLQRIDTQSPREAEVVELVETRLGEGRLLWCPVPVELSDNPAAVVALYRYAMDKADLHAPVTLQPSTPGVLALVSTFERCTLITLISERSDDYRITVRLRKPSFSEDVRLPAGTALLLLVDGKGELIASTARH